MQSTCRGAHIVTSTRSVLAFLALVLCTGLQADAQGGAEPAVALQGMDVVSYFKDGGPVKRPWRPSTYC
jgi:hypothetical protein